MSSKKSSNRITAPENEELFSKTQEYGTTRSEKDGFYSSCGQAFIRISK